MLQINTFNQEMVDAVVRCLIKEKLIKLKEWLDWLDYNNSDNTLAILTMQFGDLQSEAEFWPKTAVSYS